MSADRRGGVYVGLMSGTSLDGISAAVVRFTPVGDTRYEAELLGFQVREYRAAQRERLSAAMAGGTARDYCRLAADLGGWLADAAVAVMAEAGVSRTDVRAIGSHGQTLWHEPGHSTWQLDDAAVIAERCGIAVVDNFRARDVAAGGQGAPLVPIADALLFAGERWRALQNIGGIGNVTVVPPDGVIAGVRALDTGPGMRLIDELVHRLVAGQRYDEDGRLGAQGQPSQHAIDELLTDAYFATEPPKSTGRELFGGEYVDRLVRLVRDDRADASDADLVATATAFTAQTIADAYRRFLPEPLTEVLLSGGGARNATLRRMLAAALPGLEVRTFDERYFDGEAKEAVAFALLAHLHLEGRAGNVVGATGARGERILGSVTPA
jgi:anhydro-N-acetylmuramic acid kinase